MTDNRKLPKLSEGARWDDFGGVVNGDQSVTICRVDYLRCGDNHVIGILPKKGKGIGIWLSDIRAFLKVNHPDPDLEAAQRRVMELKCQLETEQLHSSALMARVNELTNPRPSILQEYDEHD
jgi:hypothetical protein